MQYGAGDTDWFYHISYEQRRKVVGMRVYDMQERTAKPKRDGKLHGMDAVGALVKAAAERGAK